MAFADQLAAIKTHAVAAGATLSPALTDVAIAHPVPRGRCVRIFWAGEVEPVRMGAQRSLNAELIAERIMLVAFWPISDSSETGAEAIETDIYALKHEIRTRVLGDSQLGGMSTDLAMSYAETDFVVISGTAYRTLECEFVTDFFEYSIAP